MLGSASGRALVIPAPHSPEDLVKLLGPGAGLSGGRAGLSGGESSGRGDEMFGKTAPPTPTGSVSLGRFLDLTVGLFCKGAYFLELC